MFGAFSKAFLVEAGAFNFLGCSFDEILLSWNMVSDFSEPTKARISCRRLGVLPTTESWSTDSAVLSKQEFTS
jgi:hypothetical protein